MFAAGECRLLRFGRTLRLTGPRLIRTPSGRGLVPAMVELPLRVFGVREFLLLEPA